MSEESPHFYNIYLASLNKLFQINSTTVDKESTQEQLDIVLRMDRVLHQFVSTYSSQSEPDNALVSHFRGQLFLNFSTMLCRRATQFPSASTECVKLAGLLFVAAFQGKIVSHHKIDGYFRKVVAGHMVKFLCDKSTDWLEETLHGIGSTELGIKIYKNLFMKEYHSTMMEGSTLGQLTNDCIYFKSLPEVSEAVGRFSSCVADFNADLSRAMWLLIRDIEVSMIEKKTFKNAKNYHSWLLNKISASNGDLGGSGFCALYGSCGNKVRLPHFLLMLVWPSLSEIISQASSRQDQEPLHILLPDEKYESLVIIKDLLTTGLIKNLENNIEHDVHELLSNYMPGINVEKLQPVSSQSDEFQFMVDNVVFEQPIEPRKAGELRNSVPCTKSCSMSCDKALHSWSEIDVLSITGMFQCDKIIDTKRKLLSHLQNQKVVGLPVSSFIVNGHEFCFKFFAHITGNSEYIIKTVLEDFHAGIEMYEHQNAGCLKVDSPATVQAICWLKSFSEAYGQYSPEENVTILSYWLNKTSLFKMYSDETCGPHISQSLFFEIFKTKFGHNRLDTSLPRIRISKYSTHSVCCICVALNNNLRQCKTQSEVAQAKSLKNNHRMNFGLSRRKVAELKQSAISFPSDHLFLQIGN